MPKVAIDKAGNATMFNARTRSYEQVPAVDVEARLSDGWLPLDREQMRQHRMREAYDAPVTAGVLGAARGLTLGASDVIARGAGVAPETLSGLEEYNPQASTVGEVAGIAASVALPLSPLARVVGAGAKAGTAAAAALTRTTGRAATSAAARITGSVVKEGVIGAAIGSGQAASDMAMGRREASLASFGEAAAEGAGFGAVAGVGVGALSAIGASAVERRAKLIDRLGLNTKKTTELLSRQRALEGELSYLKTVPEAASGARVADLTAQYETVVQQLSVDKMAKIGGAIVGSLTLGGVPGVVVGTVAGPRVLEAAKKYIMPSIKRAIDSSGRVGAEVTKRAGTAAPAIYKYGPIALEIADAAVDPIHAAKAMAWKKSKSLASEVASGVARKALHAGQAISRIERSAGIRKMTSLDIANTSRHLATVKPGDAAMDVHLAAPSWVTPEHVAELSDEAERGIAHLQSVAPVPPQGADATWMPDAQQTRDFNASLQGTLDPEALGKQFSAGSVEPATREATKAVHPAYYEQLVRAVGAKIERIGGVEHMSSKSRRSAALLLDDHSIAPRIDQPAVSGRIAAMQAQAASNQRAPSRGRGATVSVAKDHANRLQGLMEG